MNPNPETPNNVDGILDRALTEMRGAEPAPHSVDLAAARVLGELEAAHRKIAPFPETRLAEAGASAGHLDGCQDFRALIPAYLARSLAPARELLWEDHARDCVGCRKALESARRGDAAETAAALRSEPYRTGRSRAVRFGAAAAIAAAVLIAAALGIGPLRDWWSPVDAHATAQTVRGGLYLVAGQDVHAIAAGQRIERGQAVRTGSGSGAVLELADGSRIEMSARAELALAAARDGVKIALRRGNVIVTAAKQRTGHLYVETPDCAVSVVGTVFSVSAEPRGSRVAVIEGAVEVQQGSETEMLYPGQQLATDPAMMPVSVRDEIAWSQDAALHMEMLGALLELNADVSARIGEAGMRFESELIAMVPASAVVVASLPNVSEPVGTAYALFKQRIQESDTLRPWWSSQSPNEPGNAPAPAVNPALNPALNMDQIVERLTRIGAYLGTEIVLAFPKDLETETPIALAGLSNPEAALAAIEVEIGRMASLSTNGEAAIPIARNAAELDQAAASDAPLAIYVDHDWIAVSAPKQLQRAAAFRANPASNPFAATPLGRRIAQSYTEGVGWLLAADLGRILGNAPPDAGPALRWLGLDNVDQLLVEQKTGAGMAAYTATLGFNHQRHGVTAWMAEPAPMGALEFISPGAYTVAAVVTKDPASIVDELFQMLTTKADAAEALDTFQRERRVDIRKDLAEPLGNEFLLAIDGPILPTPAWRAVIEVNDAARLQNAIETTIINANLGAGDAAITLSSEMSDGRMFYRLSGFQSQAEIHYAYWSGYMILAPKRALVMNAMQTHDSANSLARSPAFRAQLPDGRDHASGVLYQNVQAIAKAIPVQGLSKAIANSAPSVVYMFGESDRIVFASKGMLGMNLANLTGLAGLGELAGTPRD